MPADTAQRGCGQHAFGGPARTHVEVDRSVGVGHRDHTRHVAVADQHDPAAEAAQFFDQFSMARPVKHADDNVARLNPFGGCDCLDVFGRALGEVDDPFGIAWADRQLVHIDVGRVEQVAFLGHGQHGERIGSGLGGDRGAFQRIERDVDLGAGALGRADLFADIEHRRFVALALADHYGSVHRQLVERGAHRFDRSMVGSLLIAAPDQL